jgi:hypothetical protein
MDSITASEMLDEFRLMEGTLFQDEEAKLFYLDIKSVVLDSLISAWDKFSTSDVLYQTALDRYYSWEGVVGHEEVERCTVEVHNVNERHFHVAVFYSRQLYGNEDFHQKIVITKPKIEILLKTLFRKLVRNLHVKSGTFFTFDPIKQDFILRDAFRQALAESIKIVEISSSTTTTISNSDGKNTLKNEKETSFTEKHEHKEEQEEEQVPKDEDTISQHTANTFKTNTTKLKETIKVQENDKNTVISVVSQKSTQKSTLDIKDTLDIPAEDVEKEKVQEVEHDDYFDVKKVPEDYNVGDSISVFFENEQLQIQTYPQSNSLKSEKERQELKSVLKVPTMVRTVILK